MWNLSGGALALGSIFLQHCIEIHPFWPMNTKSGVDIRGTPYICRFVVYNSAIPRWSLLIACVAHQLPKIGGKVFFGHISGSHKLPFHPESRRKPRGIYKNASSSRQRPFFANWESIRQQIVEVRLEFVISSFPPLFGHKNQENDRAIRGAGDWKLSSHKEWDSKLQSPAVRDFY
jgi:hypothetical protein